MSEGLISFESLNHINFLDYFDGVIKQSDRRLDNTYFIGYFKYYCLHSSVKNCEVLSDGARWGIMSLVGVVTNTDAKLTSSITYHACTGKVLVLIPKDICRLIDSGVVPFMCAGGTMFKGGYGNTMQDLIKICKFRKNSATGSWGTMCADVFVLNNEGVNGLKVRSGICDLSVYIEKLNQLKAEGFPDYIVDGYNPLGVNINFVPDSDDVTYKYNSIQEDGNKQESKLQVANLGIKTDAHVGNIEKSNSKIVVQSRDELVSKSDNAFYLSDMIKSSKDKVNTVIVEMEDFEETYSLESDIKYTSSMLKKTWNKKLSGCSRKGIDLFLNAIQRIDDTIAADGLDSLVGKELIRLKEAVIDYWVDDEVPSKESENKVLGFILEHREEIYYAIIELCLGVNGLSDIVKVASDSNFDMHSILHKNPYYLCLVDARIDIKSLDMLAMLYRVNKSDMSVKKLRNIAFIHNVMLSGGINNNTLIDAWELYRNINTSYKIDKRILNNIQTYGMVVTDMRFQDLKTYVKGDLVRDDLAYKTEELVKRGTPERPEYYCILGSERAMALKDYINSGIGLKLDFQGTKYVTDYVLAKKEEYIYNRIYDLASMTLPDVISDDELDKAVEEFENIKQNEGITGFKLEKLQADAVKLLKHMVVCLTGPAGSGKTTTAEAILYAIQTRLKVSDSEILFVAPTGKAANRLREVVKKPTGTIHSKFRIGGDDMSLRDASELSNQTLKDIKVLIIDESSMITLDLMYNLLRRVQKGTRIYFLGDIEQLPPIGFGKPFANFLSFLPCVKLEVSKRASEKSLINYNAKVIINNSEAGSEFLPLKSGEDFKLIDVQPDEAVIMTNNLVRWHLGLSNSPGVSGGDVINQLRGLHPDDIQIITPFSSKEKASSSYYLNKLVQDAFNPTVGNQRVCRVAKDREGKDFVEFRIGDRVINNKNNTEKHCFIRTPDGLDFIKKGVMNGDVGKIVAFYYASDLRFISDDYANLYKGSDTTLFFAVEFNSVDDDGNECDFVCLYRTMELSSTGLVTYIQASHDIQVLDLAYALTVHKLQGSQAKLVIFIAVEGTSRFICRNLIYTAITRAKEGCYVIGKVSGKSSLINEGRRIEIAGSRETIIDKL